MTELTEEPDHVHVCPECAGVYSDGADLNQWLLRANLPGVDSSGGRVAPGEATGTCPVCSVDLTRLEGKGGHDAPYFEVCEDCSRVFVFGEGDPPTTLAGARNAMTDFFKTFTARR